MASALRDTVKQRTAELAASIQETDWKKELGAFQQGLKEDTQELSHKTKAAVEHLPVQTKAVVEHLKTDHVSWWGSAGSGQEWMCEAVCVELAGAIT